MKLAVLLYTAEAVAVALNCFCAGERNQTSTYLHRVLYEMQLICMCMTNMLTFQRFEYNLWKE